MYGQERFVSFGGTNLRASLIKEYYIYKPNDLYLSFSFSKGPSLERGGYASLVIKTSRRSYVFAEGECGFDIYEKKRELDRLFS